MRKSTAASANKVAKAHTNDQGTSPPPEASPKEASKLDRVIQLLRRAEGATLEELMTATGWQAHSVRGAIAGAVKSKIGVAVQSVKEGDVRVYRVGPS